VETKTVEIPDRSRHQGIHKTTVTLEWVCPVCEEPRGEVKKVLSYDGSRRMQVDGWENPCCHVDKYADVIQEAAENGLN
jgi:rubredoxin